MVLETADSIFHDEDAARRYFEALRWPEGVVCSLCGVADHSRPVNGTSMGPGWYYCAACQGKFTVRVGTVYERSHIPLTKWAYAFQLMSSAKKGVSASHLQRTLNINYKSAWFMVHRIRKAMREGHPETLGREKPVICAEPTPRSLS